MGASYTEIPIDTDALIEECLALLREHPPEPSSPVERVSSDRVALERDFAERATELPSSREPARPGLRRCDPDAETLPPPLPVFPRRGAVVFEKPSLPLSFPEVEARASLVAAARLRSQVDTVRTRRRAARWPIFLCALVAVAAAGEAVLVSPLGNKPAVQRVVRGAKIGAIASKAAVWRAAHAVREVVADMRAP